MEEIVDQQEFPAIYEQHKDKVWRLVSRYVYSHHDRKDLFQEVWLKIHQALAKFRGESEIGTWISRLKGAQSDYNASGPARSYAKTSQTINP
ncbi:MAG: sigma factor [bacterium]